jgi:hypothetical protein
MSRVVHRRFHKCVLLTCSNVYNDAPRGLRSFDEEACNIACQFCFQSYSLSYGLRKTVMECRLHMNAMPYKVQNQTTRKLCHEVTVLRMRIAL